MPAIMWSRRLLANLKTQLPGYRWDLRVHQSGGYLFADKQKRHVKVYLQRTRKGYKVVFFLKRGGKWLSDDDFEVPDLQALEEGILDWFSLLK